MSDFTDDGNITTGDQILAMNKLGLICSRELEFSIKRVQLEFQEEIFKRNWLTHFLIQQYLLNS